VHAPRAPVIHPSAGLAQSTQKRERGTRSPPTPGRPSPHTTAASRGHRSRHATHPHRPISAATRASTPVAARPRERQPGALTSRRGSGREQALRRLLQPRQSATVGRSRPRIRQSTTPRCALATNCETSSVWAALPCFGDATSMSASARTASSTQSTAGPDALLIRSGRLVVSLRHVLSRNANGARIARASSLCGGGVARAAMALRDMDRPGVRRFVTRRRVRAVGRRRRASS
jgi:hypothetical protein